MLILRSGSAQAVEILPQPPEKPLAVQDVTLFGLKLRTANLNDIRKHLWRLGGFLQAHTTLRQINVDRFYSWSRSRDSYYVEFHYDPKGRFQWAVQVFRYHPHKILEHAPSPAPLTTTTIMNRLRQQLGPPQTVRLKQASGMPAYPRYEWQDEVMEVIVDRMDGDPLQPVVVIYRLKRFYYDYDE